MTRLLLALLLLAPLAAEASAKPAATARPGASARAAAADASTRGRPRLAPRMLDDTRIEGELPVPQVLFITARDQRRFMEFQHHRYQVTSLDLGRSTPGPALLVVPTPSPDKAKQEVAR